MKILRLIRLRQIIRHQTPTRREITDEYTFLNDSGEAQDAIVVEAYDYRANLHVYDSDGEELAIYTNSIVREYLKGQDDAKAVEILANIDSRKKYVQWIPLPKGKEIQRDEARIIRFVYTDRRREYVMKNERIFNIPEFTIGKVVEPSTTYMSHFIVIPPEGFEVKAGDREAVENRPDGPAKLTKSEHYQETFNDELLEFVVPYRPNKVTFHVPYTIRPEKYEAKLFNSFFLGLYLVSVGFIIAAGLLKPSQITPSVVAAFAAGEASIVAICVGFLGLVTNPLTHRMKFYMCVPMILAAITLLVIVLGL
jgi:hypothetical protein